MTLTDEGKQKRFEQFLLDNPGVVRLSDIDPDKGPPKVRYFSRKGAARQYANVSSRIEEPPSACAE